MRLEWNAPTGWWLLAGILTAAEMATGTFYLLMVAIGAACGALTAHLGAGFSAQLVTAAAAGVVATSAWHFKRARGTGPAPAQSNRDVNLDIGQTVQVAAWNTDRTARIPYRGAAWAAQFAGPGEPAPGEHVIVAVEGSRLQLVSASSR